MTWSRERQRERERERERKKERKKEKQSENKAAATKGAERLLGGPGGGAPKMQGVWGAQPHR